MVTSTSPNAQRHRPSSKTRVADCRLSGPREMRLRRIPAIRPIQKSPASSITTPMMTRSFSLSLASALSTVRTEATARVSLELKRIGLVYNQSSTCSNGRAATPWIGTTCVLSTIVTRRHRLGCRRLSSTFLSSTTGPTCMTKTRRAVLKLSVSAVGKTSARTEPAVSLSPSVC
jgi:hypothetical protein